MYFGYCAERSTQPHRQGRRRFVEHLAGVITWSPPDDAAEVVVCVCSVAEFYHGVVVVQLYRSCTGLIRVAVRSVVDLEIAVAAVFVRLDVELGTAHGNH